MTTTTRTANLISAVPTLFTPGGSLDLAATRTAYEQLAEHPIDAVFVGGTTGEFVTLTDAERLDLCAVAGEAFGPDRTFWHVGAASAHQAAALTRAAVGRGARLLAALTPHYFAATESALLTYYERVVASAADAPVYGYLFPARTTTQVSPQLLVQLVGTGLAGVKISGQPYAVVAEYVDALRDADLPVYSGGDGDFADVVDRGAAGVVSGVSSVLPGPFLAVRDALRDGDHDALPAAVARSHRAIAATQHGDLAHLKAVLELRGLPAGGLRAPLDVISPQARAQLAAAVSDLL